MDLWIADRMRDFQAVTAGDHVMFPCGYEPVNDALYEVTEVFADHVMAVEVARNDFGKPTSLMKPPIRVDAILLCLCRDEE